MAQILQDIQSKYVPTVTNGGETEVLQKMFFDDLWWCSHQQMFPQRPQPKKDLQQEQSQDQL